jgi:hypothetical protein
MNNDNTIRSLGHISLMCLRVMLDYHFTLMT